MSDISLHSPALIDLVLPFQIDALDVRGRAVRLGPLLNEILQAHDYPAPVALLLAEALALTALLGSMLRDDSGQVTLQARGDGPVTLLVCDYLVPGQLRGYCSFDATKIAGIDAQSRLETLCGKGYFALTMDQKDTDERYQGIVPLEGENISALAATYFRNSEQLPTLCKLDARYDGIKNMWVAGGVLIQHLPQGEEGNERLSVAEDHPHWAHARALAETISGNELTDPSLSLEDLLWRLYHETPPRVFTAKTMQKGCRCSIDRVKSVLRQFSMEELMDMREPDGTFKMNCAFCSKDWVIERPVERA
jgi:molecular chaperone Hsp33